MRVGLLASVVLLLPLLGLPLGVARGSGDEPPPAQPPAGPPAPAAPVENVAVGQFVTASGDAPAEVLEEAAHLGDQLVPLLAAHFEAPVPKEALPLKVAIHATREGFRKAVLAEGGVETDVASAGGYTPKKTLVSHLWVQAEAFDTRRLVLHELTHQVQDKTFAEYGPGTDTEWHREGLAEYFGWHVRTAKGLRVGAMDALAKSRRPSEFAEQLGQGKVEVWKSLTGGVAADYTTDLGLVYALLTCQDASLRERFRGWERDAWRHREAAARFAKTLGGDPAEVERAVGAVWARFRPRFEVFSGTWDETEQNVVGAAAEGAMLLTPVIGGSRSPVRPDRAHATVARGSARFAGVMLGRMRLVCLREELRLEEVSDAAPRVWERWALPAGRGERVVLSLEGAVLPEMLTARAEWEGSDGVVEVRTVSLQAAGGRPGLCLEGGASTFAEILLDDR